MANKKRAGKLFLLSGMFVLSLSLAFGQAEDTPAFDGASAGPAVAADGETPGEVSSETGGNESAQQLNYYIDRSGDEPRFIQRLLWEETEYVLYYEVIVEHLEGSGSYTEAERVRVEQTFAEFSLIAGHYRYRLEVYDLLEELCLVSEWREFDIIRALQPELTGFSPQAFYLDEDEVWNLTLYGQNLIPESEIFLEQGSTKIVPLRYTSDGVSALLIFSGPSLVPGEYEIYVRNPGGLDAFLGIFSITNKKPFDFNIYIGYAPVIPLYGFLWKDSGDHEAPFIDGFYPLGAAAKINFIPIKRTWGYLGVEISGSFTYFSHEREYYSVAAFFVNAHLGVLYQKYFFKKVLMVNATLGAGVSTMLNFHYEYDKGPPSEDKTELYPSLLAGLSATFFFRKPFYINAGADFIQMISPPEDGIMSGFIRPLVTVGIHL